jgi:hypothetical protein
MTGGERQPLAFGELDETPRVGDVRCQRLFDEDWKTGMQAGGADLAMREGRSGDAHCFDLIEQFAEIGRPRAAVLLADGSGLCGARVGDSDKLDAIHRRQNASVVTP